MRLASWLPGVALLFVCGCPGRVAQPGAKLEVKDVISRLASAREAKHSFTSESVMEFWFNGQRMKGTVDMMGEPGAKMRLQLLSPAGGSPLLEMACDGTSFVLVDIQNNCTLTGPCDERSIEQFFHIALAPDDFFHLALGTPPVLDQATGTVTWDANKGVQRVKLDAPAGKQTLAIDTRDGQFDVVESELTAPDGKVVWSVKNGEFVGVKNEAGPEARLPGKTHFASPDQKSDLSIEWQERKVNLTINPAAFKLDVPAGLATCGQQPRP